MWCGDPGSDVYDECLYDNGYIPLSKEEYDIQERETSNQLRNYMNIPPDFEIVMHAGTISEQHNQILDYFKDKKALYIHSGKESESFSKQKDQKDLIIYDYKRIENIDDKI